jgi:putative transferase (TIGR04331 family)
MQNKKNILVIEKNIYISSKKNYIFLSKYLFNFYKQKNNKQFNIYDQDYIFNSKGIVEKNFFFIYKKIEIYRSQLIKKLNFYHNTTHNKYYWGLILDSWLFLLISLIKVRYDIVNNSKIISKNFFLGKTKLNQIYFDTHSLLSDNYYSSNINNYIYYNLINFFKKKKDKNKKEYKNKNVIIYKFSKYFFVLFFYRFINFFILIYVKIYQPVLIISGYIGFKNSLLIFIKSFGKILPVLPNYLFFKINNPNINYSYRSKIQIEVQDKFDEIFNLIVKDLLPMSFLENFKAINKINNFNFLASNIRKICSAQFHFDDYLRILSAEVKKNKKELIVFQHGAYIGLRKKCLIQYLDNRYGDKVYYWNSSGGLGDNYLSRLRKITVHSKESIKKNILFFASPLRLNLTYLSFNHFDNSNHPYLNEGYDLYEYLDIRMRRNFKVKLFPSQFLKSLAIDEWNLKSGNKIEFVKEWNEVYQAKVIVLDNISTAFYEAVRLNIPVLVFTDIKKFNLKKKYEKLFINLKKLNIIHDNPFSVANFINQKYHNIDFWWNDVTRTKEFKDLVKFTMPKNKKYVSCIVKELLKSKF